MERHGTAGLLKGVRAGAGDPNDPERRTTVSHHSFRRSHGVGEEACAAVVVSLARAGWVHSVPSRERHEPRRVRPAYAERVLAGGSG